MLIISTRLGFLSFQMLFFFYKKSKCFKQLLDKIMKITFIDDT